jgi:hypothetical protein
MLPQVGIIWDGLESAELVTLYQWSTLPEGLRTTAVRSLKVQVSLSKCHEDTAVRVCCTPEGAGGLLNPPASLLPGHGPGTHWWVPGKVRTSMA